MKKRFMSADMMLAILAVACVMLSFSLVIANPLALIPVLVVMAILIAVFFFNIRRIRTVLTNLLHGAGYAGSETQFSFTNLSLPVMILAGKDIVWYNDAFRADVLKDHDASLVPVSKIIPGFDIAKASEKSGQSLRIDDKRYTAYGAGTRHDGDLFVAYFIDDTTLKIQSEEYVASRPSVMIIALDTYEEILKELRESERAQLASEVDLALERFIGKTSGFLRRVSAAKYIAVIEERHMKEIERNRFDILDTVRSIGTENTAITLSIGVGRGGQTLQECEAMAVAAMDMALGRGGDQAAVKSENGYEFYGGVSRSVEKRSKVKSRIIATAMKDLISQSDSVLIMGHKMSDLDSVGSAIGVLRFCKICEKPAAIVIKQKQSLAENLIKQFQDAGFAEDFVAPDEVIDNITSKTLLVVVDTHLKNILESVEVYENCKNVVVIDHHRKCVGHIDNAVIFYHEPYASSASELVSELLPYIGDREDKPTALEAQALLAGIMLDTRNFSLHTGVRTFEAAAYLRRMGAQTQEVKKLFSSSFESYSLKSQLVTEAQIYMGCAVVVSETPVDLQVIVPQAANDLLTIEGVEASFVAVEINGQINISARSMGAVNVQVIMEKLGGGGHLTMAGAQLKDISLEQAHQALLEAISNFREDQKKPNN